MKVLLAEQKCIPMRQIIKGRTEVGLGRAREREKEKCRQRPRVQPTDTEREEVEIRRGNEFFKPPTAKTLARKAFSTILIVF